MICRMTGIICPYANENGYCDSTACHNMDLVGNIIPKERPENISNSSIWVKPQSNWHTGIPTEEGWYLLHYPECKEQPYELAQWNGEHFVAVKPFHAIIVRIEASSVPYWHKIEEN